MKATNSGNRLAIALLLASTTLGGATLAAHAEAPRNGVADTSPAPLNTPATATVPTGEAGVPALATGQNEPMEAAGMNSPAPVVAAQEPADQEPADQEPAAPALSSHASLMVMPALDLDAELDGVLETLTASVAAQAGAAEETASAEPASSDAPPQAIMDTVSAAETAAPSQSLDEQTRAAIGALITEGWQPSGREERRDLAALTEFYAARDNAPFLVGDAGLTPAANAILGVLAHAEEEGLDPAAYALAADVLSTVTPDAAAAAEIALARAALHYARDAYTGRVVPASIAEDITIERHFADPAEILAALSTTDDAGTVLAGYNPPHQGYRDLRDALARLRAEANAETHVEVPAGRTLRLGDRDERVALLRQRLGVAEPAVDPVDPIVTNATPATASGTDTPATTDAAAAPQPPAFDANRFDESVDEAVKVFQTAHGLTADGIVGPATLATLNANAGDLIPEVIANMERWRWLARDLGRFHVFVNVPEYRVFVYRNGEMVHTTRVIVGQRDHRTPIFSDEMEHIVINPYWNVPSSILSNEMMPRIQADPSYLSRANYEVVARVGGRAQVVDPSAVDWSSVRRGQVSIRQRPGGGNALGQVKFMFPNQHSVYLHDTSSRGLFARDSRALSHGCVRVENPFDFADAILSEEQQWTPARVRGLVGGAERTIMLDSHLPVHITYFTARVEDGELRMFGDIYGHNARTRRALGL